MKNSLSSIKNKILSRYALSNESIYQTKTADINVLLNRVKLDKKKEGRKKILFTAAASMSVVLFGFLVF
jgi:hypothetical protein|tara:strand:- start:199 stop:405 length:207 start_codon:yes stop_codon:yes gene_type:complete